MRKQLKGKNPFINRKRQTSKPLYLRVEIIRFIGAVYMNLSYNMYSGSLGYIFLFRFFFLLVYISRLLYCTYNFALPFYDIKFYFILKPFIPFNQVLRTTVRLFPLAQNKKGYTKNF